MNSETVVVVVLVSTYEVAVGVKTRVVVDAHTSLTTIVVGVPRFCGGYRLAGPV